MAYGLFRFPVFGCCPSRFHCGDARFIKCRGRGQNLPSGAAFPFSVPDGGLLCGHSKQISMALKNGKIVERLISKAWADCVSGADHGE